MALLKEKTNVIQTAEFHSFVANIKERIKSSRLIAMRAVNKELIQLYWNIGESIVKKQTEQNWGSAIVEALAQELQLEFPGMQGFSSRNIWRMKSFYITYADNVKLAQPVREIEESTKLPQAVAEIESNIKLAPLVREIEESTKLPQAVAEIESNTKLAPLVREIEESTKLPQAVAEIESNIKLAPLVREIEESTKLPQPVAEIESNTKLAPLAREIEESAKLPQAVAEMRNRKLQQLVAEIGWSHNIVILEKCKNNLEREYYIKMTKQFGWSRNILVHNIENKSYEMFLINQTSFDKELPEKYKDQAKLAVKDEYAFDFLGLTDEYSESELENGLINNIRKFLAEMGGDFCFMGNQYRIEVDGDEFFIDLLFFHRRLQCMIAVELKTGKFKPEYAGKMSFYLSALDHQVKLEDENKSIGLIICKDKNRTVVEYTLQDTKKPMGVATYTTRKDLPKSMHKLLPTAEDIARRLERFLD